ncbi:MAG: hypothetical protein ACJ76N_01655 [Thermoanaerobaculia bacterium]
MNAPPSDPLSGPPSDSEESREPGLADLLKSMLGFSWAMSLLGVRSLANLADPGRAASDLDAVTQAAEGQLGSGLQGVFRTGDQLQRGMVDSVLGGGLSGPATAGSPSGVPPSGTASPSGTAPAPVPVPAVVSSGALDTTTFVALGEGLTAGAADFFLSAELQRDCFPAQMARQMRTRFAQALLQAPGLGNLPGFPPLPVEIPALMQTTVVEPFPDAASALGNLAVPGFRIGDALHLRPCPPVVHAADARQTGANLILGLPELLEEGSGPYPTQLERALERRPTFTLLALGYTEAVEAALAGDSGRLPDTASLRRDYERLLDSLCEAGSQVLVLNIPDPFDTACVSTIESAAQVVKVQPAVLLQTWELRGDDWITVRGLIEMGFQLLSRGIRPLPEGYVVKGEAAGRIRDRIQQLNGEIAQVARKHRAPLVDLHALWRTVRAQGVDAGSQHLTADFLGGFYSYNGYYPGKTGHALIANLALWTLNQTYGAEFPLLDLASMAATDPVTQYQPAGGPDLPVGQMPAAAMADTGLGAAAAATSRPAARAATARQALGQWPGQQPAGKQRPLTLPPGLEQVLPLNKERSYFGDALRAVDCQDPKEAQWGSCGGVLFGGLAMVDSHLNGQLHIRFSPPVNNVTRFEVTLGDGLVGDDGTLAAPLSYKLPSQRNSVTDLPNLVSWGEMDLATGQAALDDQGQPILHFNFTFFNTALGALVQVNPNFPQVPISFPGQYGSAWVQFTQRPDGKLDVEFFGSTFLPLGNDLGGQPVRFPLPFAGATLQFASIPTRGLALHPHINLSTREEPLETPAELPEIPTNTVREYTFFTHDSAFGDAFTLEGPFLGGTATGRSQLMGRLHVQFGERAGNSVPIYVSAMIPGGYLAPFPPSPLSQEFPGRLSPGPLGFNEFLRFPLKSYYLDDVFLLSDPFDLSVAAVDVRTGATIAEQLHRGFIGQNLFFALLRVEPRTPKASFQFRGPAIFQKAPQGQTVYRFEGQVKIPYPPGFLFPNPNLATGFPAGPDSSLDPFFWIQAMDGGAVPRNYVKQGGEKDVLASTGDRFSYRYAIPADPGRQPAVFEYDNLSQKGSFRLRGLTWVHFSNSRTARSGKGNFDTVTFAGFGIWGKEGVEALRAATVQISTTAGSPYVGIQIEGGAISNVNTKPLTLDEAKP